MERNGGSDIGFSHVFWNSLNYTIQVLPQIHVWAQFPLKMHLIVIFFVIAVELIVLGYVIANVVA